MGKDNKSKASSEEESGGQETRHKASPEEDRRIQSKTEKAQYVHAAWVGKQHDGSATLEATTHGHGRITLHEEQPGRNEAEGGEHDDEEDAHEDEQHEGDGGQ